jgi:hypothetical protein
MPRSQKTDGWLRIRPFSFDYKSEKKGIWLITTDNTLN